MLDYLGTDLNSEKVAVFLDDEDVNPFSKWVEAGWTRSDNHNSSSYEELFRFISAIFEVENHWETIESRGNRSFLVQKY